MGKIETFQKGGVKVASAGKVGGFRKATNPYPVASELLKREVPIFIEAQNDKRSA